MAMLYGRGGGAALFILVSIVALFIGMWRLVEDRKWSIVGRYFLALASYVWLWRAVDKVENADLRLWLALPLIFLGPVWLVSGILVFRASEGRGFFKPIKGNYSPPPPGRLATCLALAGLAWGVGCFVYGAFNTPTLGKDTAWLVIITYLPLVYGISTLHARLSPPA